MSQQRRDPQRSERAQAGHLGLGSAGRGTARGDAMGGTSWGGRGRGSGVCLPSCLDQALKEEASLCGWLSGAEWTLQGGLCGHERAGKSHRAVCPARRHCPACPTGHASGLCGCKGHAPFPSKTPQDPLQRDVQAPLKGEVGAVASWLRCVPLTQAACFPDHSLMTSRFLL